MFIRLAISHLLMPSFRDRHRTRSPNAYSFVFFVILNLLLAFHGEVQILIGRLLRLLESVKEHHLTLVDEELDPAYAVFAATQCMQIFIG